MTEIKTWVTRLEVKPINTSDEIEAAMQAEILELRAALAQQSMQLAHDSVTIECLNDKVMGLLAQQGEPVAFMRPSVDGYDAAYRDACAVDASKSTGATHWDDNGWIPLYAHSQPLQQGEPVAWIAVDAIGERFLCFSKPEGESQALYLHPQPAHGGC